MTTPAFAIRPAVEADRPALLAMSAELREVERALRPTRRPGAAMAEEYMALAERRVAAGDGAVLLAEAPGTGAPIGFLVCATDDDLLEGRRAGLMVHDAYVRPAWRGRGVLRALMAAAEAHASARGHARIAILAIAPNAEARAAYRALGFAEAYIGLERTLAPA